MDKIELSDRCAEVDVAANRLVDYADANCAADWMAEYPQMWYLISNLKSAVKGQQLEFPFTV